MFSSDRNIETLSRMVLEIKRYVGLQKECFKYDFVAKLTRLLSALVLGAILFLIGACVLLFLSVMLASALAPLVGGQAVAYGIITACYLLAAYVIYRRREQWIISPIAGFLGQLFLSSSEDKKEQL